MNTFLQDPCRLAGAALLSAGLGAFQPAIAAQSSLRALLAQSGRLPPATRAVPQARSPDSGRLVQRCDQLAGDPVDPRHTGAGVTDQALSASDAVAACTSAARSAPGNPRIQFQLGRALLAAQRPTEAVAALQQAANARYPAALAYLSEAYRFGAGGLAKDEQQANRLAQMASAQGYQTAAPSDSSDGPDDAAPPIATATARESVRAKETGKQSSLPGDFEKPDIIRAVYNADFTALQADRTFNLPYLLTHARILKEECQSFKLSDLRRYEENEARRITPRSENEMMQQGVNSIANVLTLMANATKNPQSVVDAGAAQQRIEDAAEYAAHDIVEFTRTHGACGSAPLERYARNLRSYFDTAAFGR